MTRKEAERFAETYEQQQEYRRKLLQHLKKRGLDAPASGPGGPEQQQPQ